VNYSIAHFKEDRNEIIFMTKEQAKDYFKATKYNFNPFGRGDMIPFFDIWFKQQDRRSVDNITYEKTDNTADFYMPVKFAYQKVSTINDEAMGYFMDLIDITSNHNELLKTYLLSYLAHLVQKPFDLPGTALVITGAQGTGKDTLFDFIGSKVLGDHNWADYSDNGLFFDHYDTSRAGKFLCKLQEADGRYCKPNAPKLKGMITAKTIIYNPKCKPSFELPNCIRQIFTTNKENPFAFEHGERRYVVFSVSTEKKGNHEYWTALNKCFNSDGAGYTIGAMLSKYDISKFNPRELPPNDYVNMINEVLEKSDETFLKSDAWDGEPCNIGHLFSIYRTYCENENMSLEATNNYGMKNLLTKYVNQKRLIKYNKGIWAKI
jgi:hypothetical protein